MVEKQGTLDIGFPFIAYPEIADALAAQITKLFLGDVSVDEALANMQTMSDELER